MTHRAFTESFLHARLPGWIAGQIGASVVELIALERLAGGFSNEIWQVDCGYEVDGRRDTIAFILRAGIEGGVSAPYDIPGQFALLKCLEHSAVPVPAPLWLEADPALLGEQFFTMRVVGGTTGKRLIDLDDPHLDAKRRSVVDALATIHNLDWRAQGIGAVLAEPPQGDSAQFELDTEIARAAAQGHGDNPDALRAIAWLKERKPAKQQVRLIHGDCNLSNFRFDQGDVVAVLDWEAARLSDPMWDIALYCRMIPRYYADQPDSVRQRERDLFLDLYRDATGRTCDSVPYWEMLFALSSAMKSEHPAFAANWSPIYWEQVRHLAQA